MQKYIDPEIIQLRGELKNLSREFEKILKKLNENSQKVLNSEKNILFLEDI